MTQGKTDNLETEPAEPSIDGRFRLNVSPRGDEVTIDRVSLHSGAGKPVSRQDILDRLRKQKVVHGIDDEAIDQLIADYEAGNPPAQRVTIATSQPPEEGQDGYLDWSDGLVFDGDTLKPSIVNTGQQLVTRVSATPGTPGKDVLGKPIKPRPVREASLDAGQGVKVKRDKLTVFYVADDLGVLHVSENRLQITPIIVVDNDKMRVGLELPGKDVLEVSKALSVEDVTRALDKRGIRHGIDQEAIAGAVENRVPEDGDDGDEPDEETVVIARGTEPRPGRDAALEWAIDHDSEKRRDRLVGPGQIIVFRQPPIDGHPGSDVFGKELPPQPPADQVISPGDGVETKVSVGGEEFRAKRLGTVEMNNGIISVLSLVSVSEDALAATMPLCGRTAGSQGMPVETRHVLQSLREAGIFFGVKEDYIQQHLVKAQMNDADDAETVLDCAEIVVAEGKPKVDGTEARLEIDKQITSGKLREDGRIDFRERSYPWNVAKGTVVGRIIPALRAVDGMTVYGKVIPARPAKDVDITLVGVEHRIDGQLVAISGGVLTVSKTTLSVAEALTIEGDVGIRTGHVKAATTVSVKGHVEPGSIVAAKGDIIIRENVEEAIIYASGNVVVYGGVRGRRAKIYADGQVNVSFIEGGEIYAKSDIEVSSAAIDARLESTGNIIIGPKPGLLINSHCESLGEVRVVSIGKLSSEASTVCLGVSADKQQRHKDLEEQEELTTKERFEKNWLDYYLQEAGQVPGRQALRIRSHINSDVKLSIWSKTTKIQGGNAARDYYIDPDEKKITHRPYDEKSDIPEVKRSTDETVPPDEAVAAAPAPAASDDAANEDQG